MPNVIQATCANYRNHTAMHVPHHHSAALGSSWITELITITDDTQTIRRRYADDTQTIPRRYADDTQTIPRRYPDDTQTIPRRYPDDTQTIPRRYPDDTQTIPRRYADDTQTIPRRYPDTRNINLRDGTPDSTAGGPGGPGQRWAGGPGGLGGISSGGPLHSSEETEGTRDQCALRSQDGPSLLNVTWEQHHRGRAAVPGSLTCPLLCGSVSQPEEEHRSVLAQGQGQLRFLQGLLVIL
ncbi:unnamed protein product [Boreogadus saida]